MDIEEFLGRYAGTVLLVTHDRYFLDRVTTLIVELSRGLFLRYEGNYTDFLIARAERHCRAGPIRELLGRIGIPLMSRATGESAGWPGSLVLALKGLNPGKHFGREVKGVPSICASW